MFSRQNTTIQLKTRLVLCLVCWYTGVLVVVSQQQQQQQGVLVHHHFKFINPDVTSYSTVIQKITHISKKQCAAACSAMEQCQGFYFRDNPKENDCLLGRDLERSAAPWRCWMYHKMSENMPIAEVKTPDSEVCQEDLGYKMFSLQGHQYCLKASTGGMIWSQASYYCGTDGASLVSSHQMIVYKNRKFLYNVLLSFGYQGINAWVGLTRQDGRWKWDANGEPATTLDLKNMDRFDECDEAQNGRSCDCVSYSMEDEKFEMDYCSLYRIYICQVVLE